MFGGEKLSTILVLTMDIFYTVGAIYKAMKLVTFY